MAVGTAQTNYSPQVAKNVNQNITEEQTQGVPIWAIAALGFFGMGVLLFVVQRVNKD